MLRAKRGGCADMIPVITATLGNRPDELARCMESVAAQTVPVEHVVHLDAHRSTARTRNDAIAHLCSRVDRPEWVAIIDDDDTMHPWHIEALLSAADDDVHVVYSFCDGYVPSGCNAVWGRKPAHRKRSARILRQSNFIPSTILLRTSAWQAVGGYPDVYAEDWALLLRVLGEFGPDAFACVPKATWIYHRSPDGKSANRPKDARAEALRAGGVT